MGMPFEQAAVSFGWGNLFDFANNLPQGCATARALHPKEYQYASPIGNAAMIADVYDAVTAFAYMYAKANGGKAKRPEPYPRPWANKSKNLGSKPIPIKDFNEWYYGGE